MSGMMHSGWTIGRAGLPHDTENKTPLVISQYKDGHVVGSVEVPEDEILQFIHMITRIVLAAK